MKRPFVVTLLQSLVLLLAVWNVFQICSVLQRYDLMRSLNLSTEANLLIVIGADMGDRVWVGRVGLVAAAIVGTHVDVDRHRRVSGSAMDHALRVDALVR